MLYIWLCCLVEAHLIMLVISVAAGRAVGGVGVGGWGLPCWRGGARMPENGNS